MVCKELCSSSTLQIKLEHKTTNPMPVVFTTLLFKNSGKHRDKRGGHPFTLKKLEELMKADCGDSAIFAQQTA